MHIRKLKQKVQAGHWQLSSLSVLKFKYTCKSLDRTLNHPYSRCTLSANVIATQARQDLYISAGTHKIVFFLFPKSLPPSDILETETLNLENPVALLLSPTHQPTKKKLTGLILTQSFWTRLTRWSSNSTDKHGSVSGSSLICKVGVGVGTGKAN